MAYIYKAKRSPYWYIAYTDGTGKTYRFSSRTRDRKVAADMAKVYEGKAARARLLEVASGHDKPLPTSPPPPPDLEWIFKRWYRFNPRERQAIIFAHYKGCCAYCNKEVTIPERRAHFPFASRGVIDHRIPSIAGGSDSFDNLVLACQECNQRKSDKGYEAFLAELAQPKLPGHEGNAR